MEKLTRKSGIDNVGDIHWGSRLCVLYRNEDELINIIVPYFKDGLKNNEFCLWITSSPLFKVNIENELKKYITCLNKYPGEWSNKDSSPYRMVFGRRFLRRTKDDKKWNAELKQTSGGYFKGLGGFWFKLAG